MGESLMGVHSMIKVRRLLGAPLAAASLSLGVALALAVLGLLWCLALMTLLAVFSLRTCTVKESTLLNWR